MALLPIQTYFSFNSVLKPVIEFVPSENEGGIYEVLRVVNGVPLFLEDHLKRFYHSAEIAKRKIPFSKEEIVQILEDLIVANAVEIGNILISFKSNLKAFFISHNYPSESEYLKGVKCGIFYAERQNPNAKVFQTTVRQQANKIMATNSFYEVLLVDKNKMITEGSRSNVFFIKDEKIFTPAANKVLLGVTRKKTIYCAQQLGIDVVEKAISIDELNGFEAAFITGTSPKILPIKQVDSHCFNVENKELRALMLEFENLVKDYIKNAQL